MPQTGHAIFFAVCALVILSQSVDAAITFNCDTAYQCEGPLLLTFPNTRCNEDSTATAVPIVVDVPSHPNISENTCLEYQSWSSRYTCGNGMYRETRWFSTDCSGDPSSEVVFTSHTCMSQVVPGIYDTSTVLICGPEDVNITITPPADVSSNPADPLALSNEFCPDGVCRPGWASETTYDESRTCTGNSQTLEFGYGQVGICYRLPSSSNSIMTTCDENALRSTTYAGTCSDVALYYNDIFRASATCSIMGTNSSRETHCPTTTLAPTRPGQAPTFAPTRPGHASALTLPVLLAFILIAIASSISF